MSKKSNEIDNDMLDDMARQLEDSGDYRVIKRFSPVEKYNDPVNENVKKAVYLDVETTGLDAEHDKIIELAMVPFEFDSNGKIYRVLPAYNAFQDPGIPIPEEITRITGITEEMVAGQSIDIEQVSGLLADTVLVIAHNARFDRPFMENLYAGFQDLWWGCSMADINWRAEGIESSKLEYLAYKYGFFYEGHRATIDCLAGIHLLSKTLPASSELAMKCLLESARRADYRLWAVNAPFDMKDQLKSRGYRWSSGDDGGYKAWYIDIPEPELDNELEYLQKEIYSRPMGELPKKKINAQLRYSTRL
jgi:DNA polymerase-3 subunit epsilon